MNPPAKAKATTSYAGHSAGSEDLVRTIVNENLGWSSAIARSVAKAWNLDWQLDGLDGGAYEALIFCARRFDPNMGVPFRAYARRRIHEAATEEARKSKSWQRGVGASTESEVAAREISYSLFHVFPELREGLLPVAEEGTGDEDGMRRSIRQMLTSASVIAALQGFGSHSAEAAIDFKRLIELIASLESVHQEILWAIYWQGKSMRNLAEEWGIDELNIVREHKALLEHVNEKLSNPNRNETKALKIRPGLRQMAQKLKRGNTTAPFSRMLAGNPFAVALLLANAPFLIGMVVAGYC